MTDAKKTIMVVDDQAELRKSIVRILKVAGYDTIEATNGKIALHLLGTEKVDLIVSDIRMPEMHGIELLHNVRRKYGLPFVMMTGFSEIIETTEAYEIGVDGFLLKPFQQSSLLSTIQDAFKSREKNEKPKSEASTSAAILSDQYCGIPVDEFVSGREIKFPIFLRLSGEKVVCIAHCGEDLPASKIESLKAKGIKFLYLQREDFKKYVLFTAKLSEAVLSGREIELSRKARFLRHCSEMILEYGFQQHVDKEIFDLARKNVEQSLSLLTDDKSLFELLESLTSHSTPTYAHSVGVALVASLMAKTMGWESSLLLFRVVAGGIFHDIGKKDIDQKLLSKTRSEMSTNEVRIIETHPRAGADMLSAVQGIPDEIVQVVAQHHELCDGSGYPNGLGSSRIQPVAKVIAVADEFCKWYKGAPGYGNGCTPARSISEMENKNSSPGSSSVKWEALPALKKVFVKS